MKLKEKLKQLKKIKPKGFKKSRNQHNNIWKKLKKKLKAKKEVVTND